MMCSPIYLLGVDHVFQDDKKTHFWHYWPKEKWPRMSGRIFDHSQNEQQELFDKNIHAFKKLKHYADVNGRRICNCSPITRVKEFDMIDINDLRATKS